jgi:hypothetical protein
MITIVLFLSDSASVACMTIIMLFINLTRWLKCILNPRHSLIDKSLSIVLVYSEFQMDFQDMDLADDEALEVEINAPFFPPHLAQTSSEWSAAHTTSTLPQKISSKPFNCGGNFGTLGKVLEPIWTEPQTDLSTKAPIQCSAIHHSNIKIWEELNFTRDGSALLKIQDSTQSQEVMLVSEQAIAGQQAAQTSSRKRRPKAPTISAKTWTPHKDRFRQLYVNEGKSLEDLREIVNRELGITTT